MRFRRTLIAAMVSFTVLAGTGAAAAGAAVSDEQIAITTPPAGSKAWAQDHWLGRTMPDPATAKATEVAAFFASLTGAEQQRLVRTYPLVVGNFDGAPTALRYQANALAMEQELARQKDRAANPALSGVQRSVAAGQVATLNKLLVPGRQFLVFDPRGRGLVAEVYGDLATAQRVSVLVPGSDMDLQHFDRGDTATPLKGAAGMAQALRAEEQQVSPGTGTAVIAWSGYVTPVGLGADAATARLAEAAAPRLERLLAGLALTSHPDAAPTLLCHSYGSVVCGIAGPELHSALGISDMVVFGSPGMDQPDAAALGDGVRLWATARNPGDWIGNVPYLEVAGLGHGADPTSPDFGSRVIASTGAVGHTGYLDPGSASLRNFADIALDRYRDVVCGNNNGGCISGL
ncbi:alpha/beta hydrolase [Streptacidiphilus sp. N1-12]|uniref:Alpha/beta hydrolase n=2 Tax=Streptacidiphilus alkalitolerans TaxID=3342712 RepID=A0ABV6V8H6_9ACTN